MRTPRPAEAQAFLDAATFVWHQRFELAPGVVTPGVSDVGFLDGLTGLGEDCRGLRILDVGTTNGGLAFELARRGADVTAVDIADEGYFGFALLRDLLDAPVPFVRASVYELPDQVDGRFDVVIALGLLYHLRHPLLALDQLRRVTAGELVVESAVADADEGDRPGIVQYFRRDELGGDRSNWFAPTAATLVDMVESSGFEVLERRSWPDPAPTRASVRARVTTGPPEFQQISYERPFTAVEVDGDRHEWSGRRSPPSSSPEVAEGAQRG